jgi:hypothetical protein
MINVLVDRNRNIFLKVTGFLFCMCLSQDLSALAIPPKIIVKQSGNIKVEVRQLSVVVGGNPDAPPTGWGSFKESGDLAFVRFQIRIFRNGKLMQSDNTGTYSYREGDLPELVEVDSKRNPVVRVHFRDYTGAAQYRNLFKYDYNWNLKSKKFNQLFSASHP